MPEHTAWPLRLEHEGYASIRLERPGRRFRFDPIEPEASWVALGEAPWAVPIAGDDVVLLTFSEHERLVATAHAVRDAVRPTVVAAPEVLDWLSGFGLVEGGSAPLTVDGVAIDALPFEPIPYAEGLEIARKVWSAVSNPRRGATRLWNRSRLPRCKPLALSLTLPGGARFVHLNMALHNYTSEAWMEAAIARFGGAEWLLAGVDFEHEESFLRLVGRFGATRVLVADLLGDVRRDMGMPTTVITPLVDRLIEQGMDAYVFPSRSSLRFEVEPSAGP